METLATPVCPALLLGTANPAPRAATCRHCSWKPQDIASAVVRFHPTEAIGVLRDIESFYRKLASTTSHLRYSLEAQWMKAGLAPLLEQAQERLAEELDRLESAGEIAVSVSAYNADQDTLTVYVRRQAHVGRGDYQLQPIISI